MRFFYYLKCALQNIRLNASSAFFSVMTLTLTLMLFGIFLLFYHNLSGFLSSIQKDVEISVYMRDGVLTDDIHFIKQTLEKDERVLSFRYLSKEDALTLFEEKFAGQPLLQNLGANPLPASFEVNIKPVYQNPDKMKQITAQMRQFPGVEEVQYGVEWLQNFSDFLTLLRLLGMGIGGGLAVAVVTIIAHAIRLHFYDRSEEVEIMKLIGATHRFIKNPFLLEGMLLGTLSGALSCAAIFALFRFVDVHLMEVGGLIGKLLRIYFLPPYVVAGMILTGAFLGGIGGELSLTYLLRFRAKALPKNRFRKSMVLLFVFTSLTAWIPQVSAEEAEGLSDQKKELKRVQTEIKETKEKSTALKQTEKSILSTLEKADHRIRTYQKDATLLEEKIKKKENELGYLSSTLDTLDQSISVRRAGIMNRVRVLYREGSDSVLKVLIPSPGYPEFLKRLHYLKIIAEKEAEMLALFEEEQLQLEEKNNQLDKVKEQLVAAREPLVTRLDRIKAEKEGKHVVLERVRNERAYYEKTIEELGQSQSQLRDLIEKLEKERRQRKEPAAVGFTKIKGQLAWPNEGAVISLFGRQKHPRFNTYVFHKGIEIDTSLEEAVRAVYDGVVVFADWFKGYGMIVILDHGDNYYSVYGHLANIFVSKGEKTGSNYTIGNVGSTGLSEGKRLYFEIRHGGEPMDPLAWLEKRG
jgi:cell division protein FtsX/septal ring factor EnvC (AmiA/AmiB activator)